MTEKMYSTDDGAVLKFWWDTEKNNHLSDQAGRPIFDKVLYLEITRAGETKSAPVHSIERYVGDAETPSKQRTDIIDRYRKFYEDFKSDGDGGDLSGTPLDQVPWLDMRQIAALKHQQIHTVEALSALTEHGITAVGMGARDLVNKAQAWLEASQDGSAIQRYASENERLNEEVERLKTQVEELASKLDDTGKKKPGRPKKEAEAA